MSDRAPNVVSLPDREVIELQAASWIVRQEEAGLSADQQADFERWLGQSDVHRACYQRMATLWGEASVLEDLNDIADAVEPERPAPWFVRHRGMLAAAAAGAVMAVCLTLMQPRGDGPGAAQDYVSAVGEQRTIDLPDGSVVQLNTETALSFQQSDQARTVRLLRGEAFFKVAHDSRRVFTVRTPLGSVEAIGTAFATRLIGRDGLEVTVAEGRVAVSPALSVADGVSSDPAGVPSSERAAHESKAELGAGTSALYTPERQLVTTASTIEINRKLAWRDGVLVFAGEPLRTVVDDISRYTKLKIAISDAALESLPIGGYFRVGETDALFEALELSFGVTVERLDGGHVRLSRPAAEKSVSGT
ncbi:MAG: FecR domain-containing protein [Pseudomonadota bacterium]